MTLSKKDKDEIKLLIVETMKEVELGREVPSAKNSPDFDFWKDNLIELDCGLKFAPENYYEGDKRFFTWDEAKKIEKEVLIPNGFRLPTLADWTAAFCECGQKEDGGGDPDKFEKTLRLSKEGFWDCASEYGQGSFGLFWSGTPSSETSAYRLYYGYGGVNPQDNDNKGYGYSIRCVAIDEGER